MKITLITISMNYYQNCFKQGILKDSLNYPEGVREEQDHEGRRCDLDARATQGCGGIIHVS